MQIDLTGKNALITGGTRGIGRVISLTLARSGARIAAIYRSSATDAERTLGELRALNANTGEPLAIQADISDETQATRAVQGAATAFQTEIQSGQTSEAVAAGGIDILVLDAAYGSPGGPMTAQTPGDWRRNFEVNVFGAFHVIRAVAPHLRPGASVIFLSSGAGHDPLENLSGYGASKAAANHMAAILAQELGPQGVRVNVVSPGATDKSGNDPNADPTAYTESQRNLVANTALRRLGTAQDVANVVLFFASDLSGFVTGQWVRVNGGRV